MTSTLGESILGEHRRTPRNPVFSISVSHFDSGEKQPTGRLSRFKVPLLFYMGDDNRIRISCHEVGMYGHTFRGRDHKECDHQHPSGRRNTRVQEEVRVWGGYRRRTEASSHPNLRRKRFDHHQHAPHPFALLLGNTVEVDVDSFPYFRDEHVVSVSYIQYTGPGRSQPHGHARHGRSSGNWF